MEKEKTGPRFPDSARCSIHRATSLGGARIEAKYGRDLKAEGREIRGDPKSTHIGFFGNREFSYDILAKSEEADLDRFSETLLPCDCTE